jgi:hypothetical protein
VRIARKIAENSAKDEKFGKNRLGSSQHKGRLGPRCKELVFSILPMIGLGFAAKNGAIATD